MSSRKIILPTAYFPPIGWVAAAIDSEEILIEVQETYPKQTIRNRCAILTANGLMNLTVPIIKPMGNHSKTFDIKVLYQDNWPQKHYRALESAYNNSPFFQYYSRHFEQFYTQNFEHLLQLNEAAFALISKILKMSQELIRTEKWISIYPDYLDLRYNADTFNQAITQTQSSYIQVFSDRFEFKPNLSILDLIFNQGPQSINYLITLSEAIQDKQF